MGKRATSALDAALLNAVQSSSAALGELQEGLSSAQQARADVDAQLHQVGAELAELRTVTQSLRPKIMAEVGDLRGDVQAMVGSFQAAFQAAAQRVAARTEELTRYDARLASLGPDGLDGLYKELDEVKTHCWLFQRCSRGVSNHAPALTCCTLFSVCPWGLCR